MLADNDVFGEIADSLSPVLSTISMNHVQQLL